MTHSNHELAGTSTSCYQWRELIPLPVAWLCIRGEQNLDRLTHPREEEKKVFSKDISGNFWSLAEYFEMEITYTCQNRDGESIYRRKRRENSISEVFKSENKRKRERLTHSPWRLLGYNRWRIDTGDVRAQAHYGLTFYLSRVLSFYGSFDSIFNLIVC